MFGDAKWVWPTRTFAKNQRANFFFEADIGTVPDQVTLFIGCESKYWLFVNGVLAVFDGGLFRESLPGCGYYDCVNIAEYLHAGINQIAVHVITASLEVTVLSETVAETTPPFPAAV